jgi:tetratricopeptide (TPR) repeat protein
MHIDMLEAIAASDAGDLQRGLGAARKTASEATALGARRELAVARFNEGNSMRRLGGNSADTRRTLLLAAKLYKDADDLGGMAGSNIMAAAVAADAGDLDGAREQFELALSTYRTIGDGVGVASTLHNLSIVLRRQRKLSQAIERSLEAQQEFLEMGAKSGLSNAMETLGNLRLDLGDLAGAADAMQNSMKLRRELKHALLPNSMFSLAIVRTQQAEFAEAHKLIDEGRVMPTQDKTATINLNEATGILAYAEGRLSDAESAARAAVTMEEELQHIDELVFDSALLGRALYSQGRMAEAADAIAKGRTALAKVKSATGRGMLGVVGARLQAISDLPGGIASLKQILAQAQTDDVAIDIWEARLALAELEPADSKASVRARLASLSREASAQGFGLYAAFARAAGKNIDARATNALKPR